MTPTDSGNGIPRGGRSRSGPSRRRADRTRAASKDAVQSLSEGELGELFRFWSGGAGCSGSDAAAVRSQVLEWMSRPDVVMERVQDLGRRLSTILDMHLGAPRYELTVADLSTAKELSYLSGYDLEASLEVLARRGLLIEGRVNGGAVNKSARAYAVPVDLGDAILRQRRARRRGIFDTFTLRGHLDRLYDDPGRAARTPAGRVRELYKMYANESSAVARVERLPKGLRDLFVKAVMEFGGILPRGLFDRMETDLPHWNTRRWGRILEESLVGTVERLELGRYGIHHNDETLIAFNEVALAWLRRVAVPSDPDAPHDEASLGVDLVSNISRFLAFIIDHDVRFTVRGRIFKTTEKRILQDLIPNPGRELERADVLSFIYRFARDGGLIESTGERTFALTAAGREWEPQNLDTKLRELFRYALEERDLGGEYHHQLRMRRIFVRLLKRVEPEVWYDIMYLPFLARNNYLCSLDELAVDEYFAARHQGGQNGPMEDLQRMAWNVVSWVRRRIYLLGIVDLGYDAAGRPVAMRLTRIGARLLGVAHDEPALATGVGSLVVTPDFEVVLFRTGDDAELTHDLDRFCDREKDGHLLHFRLSDRSVHRALAEGMSLQRIVETLEANARTPVPQNVVATIRGWAAQAGLLFLDSSLVVRTDNPAHLERFLADPGVRPYVRGVLDEHRVQLRERTSAARMRSALRELDYLVELE